jgi:hypothetical protein
MNELIEILMETIHEKVKQNVQEELKEHQVLQIKNLARQRFKSMNSQRTSTNFKVKQKRL